MTETAVRKPVAEVLEGLHIPQLPGGAAAEKLFALIQYRDADGDTAWAVRVTTGIDDDELLGTLVGYVEHLKQVAAASWTDHETARPSPSN